MYEEITAKYKFTEEFDGVTKTTEIITNDLCDVFSSAINFLIYCGIERDRLDEYMDLYKEGHI